MKSLTEYLYEGYEGVTAAVSVANSVHMANRNGNRRIGKTGDSYGLFDRLQKRSEIRKIRKIVDRLSSDKEIMDFVSQHPWEDIPDDVFFETHFKKILEKKLSGSDIDLIDSISGRMFYPEFEW